MVRSAKFRMILSNIDQFRVSTTSQIFCASTQNMQNIKNAFHFFILINSKVHIKLVYCTEFEVISTNIRWLHSGIVSSSHEILVKGKKSEISALVYHNQESPCAHRDGLLCKVRSHSEQYWLSRLEYHNFKSLCIGPRHEIWNSTFTLSWLSIPMRTLKWAALQCFKPFRAILTDSTRVS